MLLINIHTGAGLGWGPTLDTGDLFNRYPGHAASSGCCTKVVSFLPSSANTTLALRTQRGFGGCEDKAAVFSGCSKHGAGDPPPFLTHTGSSHQAAHFSAALLHGQNLQTGENGICGAISKTIESYADTAGIGSRQGWWQ